MEFNRLALFENRVIRKSEKAGHQPGLRGDKVLNAFTEALRSAARPTCGVLSESRREQNLYANPNTDSEVHQLRPLLPPKCSKMIRSKAKYSSPVAAAFCERRVSAVTERRYKVEPFARGTAMQTRWG